MARVAAGFALIMLPAISPVVQAANVQVTPGSQGPAVATVQTDLHSLGLYQALPNGVYSNSLGTAVRTFQVSQHITADGIVGPATWRLLNAALNRVTVVPLSDASTAFPPLASEFGAYSASAEGFSLSPSAVESYQRNHPVTVKTVAVVNTVAKTVAVVSHPVTAVKNAVVSAPVYPVLQEGSTGSSVVRLQQRLNAFGARLAIDGDFGPLTLAAVENFQRTHNLTPNGIVAAATWSALDETPPATTMVNYQPAPKPAPKPAPTPAPKSSTPPAANPAPTGANASAIVAFARTLVGDPYQWGGESPTTGFDCSGLVQYVFAHFGINLPRTSYEQFDAGARVSFSQLEPGDLVFFDANGPGASHVGLYIGGGQFIAADTPAQGVRLDSFADPYWGAHFVGAIVPPGL
jgi:cell wall-associated NlpC family hydrolase